NAATTLMDPYGLQDIEADLARTEAGDQRGMSILEMLIVGSAMTGSIFSEDKKAAADVGSALAMVHFRQEAVAEGVSCAVSVAGGVRGFRARRIPLPSLDRTGKVHGELPTAGELGRYSPEDLRYLQQELMQSVPQRIQKTIELGPDKAHGD